MVTSILTVLSVLLALVSLAYALRVARETRSQAALLATQTEELKTQTDRISGMTDRLGTAAFNQVQADYFILRTLSSTTGYEPLSGDDGQITGYRFEDESGSARLEFQRGDDGILVLDLSISSRSSGDEMHGHHGHE